MKVKYRGGQGHKLGAVGQRSQTGHSRSEVMAGMSKHFMLEGHLNLAAIKQGLFNLVVSNMAALI